MKRRGRNVKYNYTNMMQHAMTKFVGVVNYLHEFLFLLFNRINRENRILSYEKNTHIQSTVSTIRK